MTGTRVYGISTMQSGTPGFQSPEQLRGEELSTSCDIYALGAVLTELFSRQPVWQQQHSSHTIMYKVATLGQMPKFDHLPQSIQKIVFVCAQLTARQNQLKSWVCCVTYHSESSWNKLHFILYHHCITYILCSIVFLRSR